MTNKSNMTILGIDPGSRICGFGVVQFSQKKIIYIDCGCIRADGEMSLRLLKIHEQLARVIEQHRPDEIAIEQIFTMINHQAALKLGQARGVAMMTAAKYAVPIFEYAPRSIKQAIVGNGAASKSQMQHMVRALLNLQKFPPEDAADALAIALCHAHQLPLRQKLVSI